MNWEEIPEWLWRYVGLYLGLWNFDITGTVLSILKYRQSVMMYLKANKANKLVQIIGSCLCLRCWWVIMWEWPIWVWYLSPDVWEYFLGMPKGTHNICFNRRWVWEKLFGVIFFFGQTGKKWRRSEIMFIDIGKVSVVIIYVTMIESSSKSMGIYSVVSCFEVNWCWGGGYIVIYIVSYFGLWLVVIQRLRIKLIKKYFYRCWMCTW